MNNSITTVNIAEVYKAERERYLREQAPKRNLSEWFGLFTPWAICLVFVAFYAQSAQHTSFVLDQLAPGIGWAGPIGVEAGLIYLAFRQRQLGKDQPMRETILRFLLFAVAVLTNFAGALYDVTHQAVLQNLSTSDILAKFAALSAPTQAALVMVVIMAFIVPIVCEVAGHGIADLVFAERREAYKENHWKKVEVKLVFQAVYNYYVQSGMAAHDAQAVAGQQVRGYFEKLDVQALIPAMANTNQLSAGQTSAIRGQERERGTINDVYAYLDGHPEAMGLSINKLQAALERDGITVSRTTAGDALRARKQVQ